MNTYQRLLSVPFFFAAMLLGACDWVDSAGSGAVSQSTISVSLDDVAVGDTIAINDSTIATLTTSRTVTTGADQTFSWSSEPIEEGKLDVCLGQAGFSDELAVDSLMQACPAGETCEIRFDTTSVEPDITEFTLNVPALFASVGLSYQLSVDDGTEVALNREFSFCFIAVNDPPVANADTFIVANGDVLNVTANGNGVNLLSNDTDDEHIGNTDFSVVPEASSQPENAAFFELGNDGSFTYEPGFTDLEEDQSVTFEYQLTDGVSESMGQVTIRVVANNQAPQLLTPLPVVLATEGEELSVDISGNFGDPDADVIAYSLSGLTPLAEGTGLEFSSEGLLSGVPTGADVGSFAFTVIASDGVLSTEALMAVEVAAAPVTEENSAPVFIGNTVFNQTVQLGEPITPVMPQFNDAENDELTFSFFGTGSLPTGVSVDSATGAVSGTPTEAGSFTRLRVRATDPSGATGRTTFFSLTVEDG